MKLPGKTTAYKDSVISLFPDILRLLKTEDMTVSELRKIIKADYGNYVAALQDISILIRN